MRYELTDLRVFIAIAERQSVSEGAFEMHLTAPSASYRLKNLESALEVSLFKRTQKGMQLTPAGKTALAFAREIINGVNNLQSAVNKYTDDIKGNIKIFANNSTLNNLSSALGEFLAKHPNINVEIEEKLSLDIIQHVAEGAVDIGLIAGDIDLNNLESICYAIDALVLITPVDHPLSSNCHVSLEDILRFDFVSLGRKSSSYLFIENLAKSLGIRPKVRVHAHSISAALEYVRSGVGIAIVPKLLANSHVEQGQIVQLPITEAWAFREQKVIARSFEKLPDCTRALVHALCESGKLV
ncbi:LysR family transcriptional regulator [Alcaligenaceae bacterium]|nr:LysR family transcriptional regulator [Alcaligenaceae bacterium]